MQTLKDVITEQGGLGPVTGIDWHVSGTRSFRYPPTLSIRLKTEARSGSTTAEVAVDTVG